MMSKLIVEMEMPTRCGACKCRHVEFDIDRVAVFCGIKDNEYVEDADSIPSWCPIVGVLPDEHGDLIDRDEVYKQIQMWKSTATDTITLCFLYHIEKLLVHARPIIAAERKDDEQID